MFRPLLRAARPPRPFQASLRRLGCSSRTSFFRIFVVLGTSPLAPTAGAAVPDDPAPAGWLGAVVVTGTRTVSRADQNLADITVIGRGEIEQATGSTLAALLARQPGVQSASNGGLGKTSSVFLRGLDPRHTLLLVDGVRHGSATLGTPAWENLPLDAIERIEIVRGPMSGLYGSDAVGGVIQVFTRQGKPGLRADGSATAGSNRFGELAGGLRFGEGAFDGSVRLRHTETRGFSSTNEKAQFGNFNPDADGFRQDSGNLHLGWRFADGWRADGRLLHADATTQYDDGAGADSRAKLRTEVRSLAVGGPVSGEWRSMLRVARSADEYTTLATASAFTPLGTIGTVQQQWTWENTLATPIGSAIVVAEHLRQRVERPGAAFAVSQRTINGVALGVDGSSGVHSWQASLRHDRNSQFGRQTTGMLAYGLAISPGWRVAASYGTSFVAPSFNQLYFPGFGNPDLLPEEGRHAELSLRWSAAGQQLRAAYFDNRIRGYISSGPAPVNIPRTRIDGMSLAYEARLGDWTLAASGDHADPRNVTAGSPNNGKQLLRRAKDSLKASAAFRHRAWTFGASMNAFGERFDDAANTLRIAGHGTVNLHADWRVAAEWTVGLRVNNVGDKTSETVHGYNQPGREAFVTVRYGAL